MGRHNKNQSKKLTTSYLIDKYLKNEKKKETTRRLNHQEYNQCARNFFGITHI
jgi:hypothetical protein